MNDQNNIRRNAAPKISLVIPLFNEEQIIPELWRRISDVLADMAGEKEVILVDDGSRDKTAELVSEICRTNPQAKLIRLSRNFGHQPALSAGLDHSSGDIVILMDGDLQDRPEALPDFIAQWRKGSDVVYAIRESRKESWLYRLAFTSFYRILSSMSGIQIPQDAGIFSLLDRRVVDELKRLPESNRYFPGLRAYVGFRQDGVNVSRDSRFAGSPRVGIRGLFKLAFDGIIAFSIIPIRLITITGVIVALLAFGYIAVILFKKYVTGAAITGWASTLTAILFIGGLQLITLGIIGEYVGRIYDEAKRRPYYVIKDKYNL